MVKVSHEVIKKWQEEFSELIKARVMPRDRWMLPENYDSHIKILWQGFLLARSTVEIELLQLTDTQKKVLPGFHRGIQSCSSNIRAQGYRVAGDE